MAANCCSEDFLELEIGQPWSMPFQWKDVNGVGIDAAAMGVAAVGVQIYVYSPELVTGAQPSFAWTDQTTGQFTVSLASVGIPSGRLSYLELNFGGAYPKVRVDLRGTSVNNSMVCSTANEVSVTLSGAGEVVIETDGVGTGSGLNAAQVQQLIDDAAAADPHITAPGTDDGIKIVGGEVSLDIINLPDI